MRHAAVATSLAILFFAGGAHAGAHDEDGDHGDDDAGPLVTDMGGVAGPDGNVAVHGKLRARYCFTAPDACVPAGSLVDYTTNTGSRFSGPIARPHAVLRAVRAPAAIDVGGASFAAGSLVELDGTMDGALHGKLARPLDVDGLRVRGDVALRLAAGRVARVDSGALDAPAHLGGFALDAGCRFDVTNLISGSFSFDCPRGKKGTRDGAGWPTSARALLTWRPFDGTAPQDLTVVQAVDASPALAGAPFLVDGGRIDAAPTVVFAASGAPAADAWRVIHGVTARAYAFTQDRAKGGASFTVRAGVTGTFCRDGPGSIDGAVDAGALHLAGLTRLTAAPASPLSPWYAPCFTPPTGYRGTCARGAHAEVALGADLAPPPASSSLCP